MEPDPSFLPKSGGQRFAFWKLYKKRVAFLVAHYPHIFFADFDFHLLDNATKPPVGPERYFSVVPAALRNSSSPLFSEKPRLAEIPFAPAIIHSYDFSEVSPN